MKKFSKEFEDEIIDLYKKNFSATAIAKMFNKNSTTILRVLKRNGLEIRSFRTSKRLKFNKIEEEFILESYKQGKNTVEIAKELDSYNTSIRRVLIKHNIELISTKDRIKYVKSNPFSENCEYSDYFLGLLITDGCISKNTITLSLKEEDIYMLKNFAEFLSPTVKVNKYFAKAHNKYQYYVKIKNDDVIKYLESKANFKNKSFDLYLKTSLNYNILRGIIDGDGCVLISNNLLRLQICTKSEQFANQLKDFFISEGFSPKINKDKRGLLSVNLFRQDELVKLKTFLYSDASIFLERKYRIWLAFLEIRNDKIS